MISENGQLSEGTFMVILDVAALLKIVCELAQTSAVYVELVKKN